MNLNSDWLTDRSAPWERLKPHIFVSSPPRGDANVVRVIQEVLSSLSDRVVVTSWEKIDNESGITLQVAERIALSRFGICYLSEPTDDDSATGFRYIDNANVVFEAGIVHALTNTPDAEPTGWISIREENSPAAPFDFSSERIVHVPRKPHGGLLDEVRFRRILLERIRALLDQS